MNGPASSHGPITLDIPGYSGEQLIGEGGMAAVYLAVQDSLGRHVALKLLKKFDDRARYQRFLNESRIIASLNHRNVITIYDVGTIDDRPYISMEFLEGGDLEYRLHKKSIGIEAALDLIEAIGACLEFVHKHGVIHRDVKPANILFHKDGTPILTDFGLAKQQEIDSRLTIDGTTVGTPYYLSPEQAECKPIDGRTDVYALGVVLYEMLVGYKPYEGVSAMETIVAHLTDPIPALPAELVRYQELVDRMLAKDPAERFGSAAEMVDYLKALRRSPKASESHEARNEQRWRFTEVCRRLEPLLVEGTARFDSALGGAKLRYQQTTVRSRVVVMSLFLSILFGGTWYLATRPSASVGDYLAKAESAFQDDRLSYPKAESAFYYYEEVLRLDAGNAEALEGFTKIAERYADLAEEEIAEFRFPTAKFYVARGLDVQPDNARLLRLERETKPLNTVPEKIVTGIRSLFNRNRRND